MTYLVVAAAYAPFAGVGANRMISFTQYLLSRGNRVVVIRNAPETWPADSLKGTVPDGIIIRDVYITDRFDECVKAYYEVIKKTYSEFDIDYAVYSCNPYYSIVAAAQLKKEKGWGFIIDFRDLWVNDETFTRSMLKRVRKTISRQRYRLKEMKCVKAADLIVTVTPRENEALKKQYPRYADKMSVVYNGYDEKRLMAPINEGERIVLDTILDKIGESYSIGVFGKFGYYDYEYVVQLLTAVKSLNEKGIKIKIVHIGELDPKTRRGFEAVGFPMNLYYGTGYLDYKTGIELLKQLTMNLLIVHYVRGLGTKLFDYIYVDKPVVYFAPRDSAISDILKTCNYSFRCETSDDAQKAITEIIDHGYRELGCPDRSKYSRTIQNQRFERLIQDRERGNSSEQ